MAERLLDDLDLSEAVAVPVAFKLSTDGTPTEVKVEKKFGITKLSVPRQEFIKMCSEFAAGFISEMTSQFEVLGCCMDPSIYYQTDAPYYRRITQITFIRMLKKGLAYKGTAPVNWCPRCITALADAEVEYRSGVTKLNYVKFGVKGTDEDVVIATTRPELICTCQIVAVHPEDTKHRALIGKRLLTPLFRKEVSVIADPTIQNFDGFESIRRNLVVVTNDDQPFEELSAWLATDHFDTFVQRALSKFDYILIDSAPVALSMETMTLTSKVDGVILMLEAERSRQGVALKIKRDIEQSGARILGTIINKRKYYIPNWLYKRF